MRKKLEQYNEHLEEQVRDRPRELIESHRATIYTLSRLAEKKDDKTGKHLSRTRLYCKIFAKRLRLNSRYSDIPCFSRGDTFVTQIRR